MKIDGKAIADGILDGLRTQVNALKRQGITPTLAVIQVGDNPASTAYIKQKKKAADQIGVKLILSHQPLASLELRPASRPGGRSGSAVSYQRIQNIIGKYSSDSSIHSVILQRPLPGPLAEESLSLCSAILLSKDVDGFLPNSPYPVPVAAAALEILRVTFSLITYHVSLEEALKKQSSELVLQEWLITKKIVILGRGETAGKPIAEALIRQGCAITVVHSQTPHPDDAIRACDIVISCVGKGNVVRRDNVKQGAILIGVGIRRDNDGKLHGDFDEDEIKDIVSYYTPTPGGVGPVNVACLMQNLVLATQKLTH